MGNGCLDWHKHKRISLASLLDFHVDIHHIFPRAWCNNNKIDADRRDSIVNKTAISFDTNRSIGGRAPSRYLPILEEKADIPADKLDEILATHAIDTDALRVDDFDGFFEDRKDRLLKIVGDAHTPSASDHKSRPPRRRQQRNPPPSSTSTEEAPNARGTSRRTRPPPA